MAKRYINMRSAAFFVLLSKNKICMQLKKVINKANNVMQNRASIRKYDVKKKIGREELTNILQDAMTAPSSFNLQPWRFVVVSSEEGKELIKPYMMFNQIQHETASAVIFVYADKQSVDYTDEILAANVEYGLMTEEYRDKMGEMIRSYQANYTPERLNASQMLDCGFVCMQLMLSAKAYGYDTNPIGGFMRKEISEILGMDADRYYPALAISIGKADEPSKDTTRFSVDEVTQWK